MNLEVDVERLLLAHKAVRAELMAECAPGGYWGGQIGSSPAATAAAVSALVVSHRRDSEDLLRELKSESDDAQVIEQLVQGDLSELLVESLHWLARRQNEDGGWGDCEGAESNIAATMLVQAAFRLTGIPAKYADLMARADDFVDEQEGVAGLRRRYGKDKSYLAAILANCALADMLSWRQVPTLPFEWLHLPKRWRPEFQTPAARHMSPVVMAVGLAKLHNDPSRNPITRLARRSLRNKTLSCLEQMQAADDSFLASPLMTAFVVMSLADAGYQERAVVGRGVEFLLTAVRGDASWPMVASVATTNTVLALESFATQPNKPATSSWESSGHDESPSGVWRDTASTGDTVATHSHDPSHDAAATERRQSRDRSIEWLLSTQHGAPSAVTAAPAGGWGDSGTPGSEPNTMATAGAVRALAAWFADNDSARSDRVERAAGLGVGWLLDLQNDDGGWGTFSHDDEAESNSGSGVDPTAHALRALGEWQRLWKTDSQRYTQAALSAVISRIVPAIDRGMKYLESQQRDDGSFVPLWFGNVHQHQDENPVLGTALVLATLAELSCLESNTAQRAASWMLASQHSCGGWGPPRAPVDYSGNERDGNLRSWRENDTLARFCSVEETAAAVSALLPLVATTPAFERAVSRGLTWLTNAVEQDRHRQTAIVGFYFAQIWYYERLYPLVYAAGALSRAVLTLTPAAAPAVTSVS